MLWLLVGAAILQAVVCSEDNGRFYIYDWPGISPNWIGDGLLQWDLVTHGFGKDFIDYVVIYLFTRYSPTAGPTVDAGKGLSQTSQYALYKIFLNRALTDSRRTFNPKEASLFFIPYDFGTDAAFHYRTGIKPRNCPSAHEVTNRLQKLSTFTDGDGSNHVVVISINSGMNHFYGPECMKFLTKVCLNCLKVSIDDFSFLFGDTEEHKKTHATMEALKSGRGLNWRAVPFPSDVHWSSRVKRPYPWESTHERDILVSFIGSNISYNHKARRLRQALVKQCQLHSDICYWLPYGANKKIESRDFSSINVANGATVHDIMSRSVFCLTPMGDLPTRKGLFDSLLLGCIPVVFHPLTATTMYTWHWTEQLWKKVVIEYLDRGQIFFQGLDVITSLNSIYQNNRSYILQKQQLIRENAFRLQYSLVEETGVVRPGADAYDIIMQHMLDVVRGKASGVRVGSVPDCGFTC